MSLKEICRACLRTGRTMCSIVESIVPKFDSPSNSVVDLWNTFAKKLIAYEDTHPDKICIECLDEIQQIYSFMLKCETSENILRKIKNVRIYLRRPKMSYDLHDHDILKNIKSEIDVDPNVLHTKIETIEEWMDTSGVYDEAIIPANPETKVDQRSQHITYIKQEPELDIWMENDESDEIESEYETHTEIFKCPVCRFECSILESLEKHIIENHMDAQLCKLCNKEFTSTAIEHCSLHLQVISTEVGLKYNNIIKDYKCQVCSKIFGWRSTLDRHLIIHTKERPFKCQICPKTFRQKHNLKAHVRNHTNVRPFKCEICPKSFRLKNTLADHLRCHTGERPFKCEICPKSFRQKNNLRSHFIRKHTKKNEKSNGCDHEQTKKTQFEVRMHANADSQINQRSQDSAIVQRHGNSFRNESVDQLYHENDVRNDEVSAAPDLKEISVIDGNMESDDCAEIKSQSKSCIDIFKCSACYYESSMMECLEKHIIENHMDGQMCKLCNKVFQCTVNEHCSIHLDPNSEDIYKSTILKEYKCETCSKSFGQKSYLKRHLKIHTGERPFKCAICLKTFRLKCILMDHLRCHTGERPFKCEFCPKNFRQKNTLTDHLRCHTGERPFNCEICPKAFRQKNALTRHLRCHTGERPFKCAICPKTFQQKIHLTDHLVCHTEDRPFKCEICSKTFRQRSTLTDHLRKHTDTNEYTREQMENEQLERMVHANVHSQVD